MQNRSKDRIAWIDMAKGYGTLLVIYAHLGDDPLRGWMYSFHLPLFFFLSGYVFRYQDSFKEFVWKKCKAIMVPYFCLGIPMVLFEILKSLLKGQFSLENAMSLAKLFLEQRRLWTLWYIACLFWLNIIFYLLLKSVKKKWILILLSVILPVAGCAYYKYGGQPLYWNVDTCVMAFPFFTGGYLYKLYAKEVDGLIERYKLLFLPIVWIVNVFAWRMSIGENGWGLEMFASSYGRPIFTYLAAFAGVFGVILVSKCVNIKQICFLGENSMLYYAWHQTIMMPIIGKILDYMEADILCSQGEYGVFLYKILWLLGILLATTICYFVIKKLRLQFMLGKK